MAGRKREPQTAKERKVAIAAAIALLAVIAMASAGLNYVETLI